MESKVIPLSDKGWILKLPTERKNKVMHSMLKQGNFGIFVEFAKLIVSEPERRGGISKEDVNSLYAEYYPGETLDL
tara:strand:- start:284 stop:511 length:228 start_codon:yes stop_codon:yes gene_type:complete